jgi:hydrogenase maturation protein HypF
MIRYRYSINGTVQGVGFRPFIYKLAIELDLKGFVLNNPKGVILELEGFIKDIEVFDERFLEELPPLAHVDNFEKHPISLQNSNSFEIIQSSNNDQKTTLVSPDIKICEECLKDIKQQPKYKNYFATNCTNCGPRYSIIQTVPYDRSNTSMSKFIMCESCQKEYSDPINRRYHAQPISCNDCGPKLFLFEKEQQIETKNIYKETAQLIKAGNIVAIKGIGGFHIICDTSNDTVIENLRKYKNRPSKPFAIMCKDIDQINSIASLSQKEEEILNSKEAPIVILEKKETQIISKYIAPNINKIGCFLPTTALHYLLFEHLGNPIIATSANLGGEPILTTKEQILEKLPFIKYIVDFNRDIINAVDDSLVQIIDNTTSMLRLARGYAPKTIKLPFKIKEKILAVGANAKSTIAIAFEDTIIVSPHIGDLDSLVSFEYFKRTIETFQRFYDFIPDIIVHDLHPNYETTKWAKQIAKEKDIKLFEVQHHLAHIYSIKAEHNLQNKEYLGFSFDGTGYGEDHTLWGGEIFINNERNYSFKPIKLIGGTKAIKEPRRIALAMLFERFSLEELLRLDLPTVKAFSESELKLLYQSYQKNINCFETSSVGRLFDGITSFADIIQVISYEGESGLLIESLYDETLDDSFEYTIDNNIIDIKFIDYILNNTVSKKSLSTMLINTLHTIIIDISKKHNLDIYLTGGVFQNKTLLEKVLKSLHNKQRKFYINHMIPSNDGGISLGQIYKATLSLKEK